MKTKNLQLVSLATAFALSVGGVVVSANTMQNIQAEAATYKVKEIFSATTATVDADATEYATFDFAGKDSAVEYRRNLAYKWFTDYQAVNYFNVAFSFENLTFDTFSVVFQSAENSISDDELATNEVIFSNAEGEYYISIRNNDDKDKKVEELEKTKISAPKNVKIAFAEGDASGEYKVNVTVDEQKIDGLFTNIGGAYAKYTASKLVPMSFKASVSGETAQKVSVQDMNSQSFKLTNGSITDNAAPVLVINEDIKSFILGTKLLDFDYTYIDVCRSTVSNSEITYFQKGVTKNWEVITSTSTKRILETPGSTDNVELVDICFNLKDASGDSNNYYHVSWYAHSEDDVTREEVDVTKGEGENATTVREYIYFLTATLNNDAPAYVATEDMIESYQEKVTETAKNIRAGEGNYFYLPSLEDLLDDDDTSYKGMKYTIYYKTDSNSSTNTVSKQAYNELKIPVNGIGGYRFKVVPTDKSGNTMTVTSKDGRSIAIGTDNIWEEECDFIPEFYFKVDNMGLKITLKDKELVEPGYLNSNYSLGAFTVKGIAGYSSEFNLYYLEGSKLYSEDDVKAVVAACSATDNGTGLNFDTLKLAFDILCGNQKVNVLDDMIAAEDSTSQKEMLETLKDTINEIGLEKYKNKLVYWQYVNPWVSDGSLPLSDDDNGWDATYNHYMNYHEWKKSARTFTPRDTGYYFYVGEFVDAQLFGVHNYAYQAVHAASETDNIVGEVVLSDANIVTIVFVVIAVLSLIGIVILLFIKPSDELEEKPVSKKGKFADKKKKD